METNDYCIHLTTNRYLTRWRILCSSVHFSQIVQANATFLSNKIDTVIDDESKIDKLFRAI